MANVLYARWEADFWKPIEIDGMTEEEFKQYLRGTLQDRILGYSETTKLMPIELPNGIKAIAIKFQDDLEFWSGFGFMESYSKKDDG